MLIPTQGKLSDADCGTEKAFAASRTGSYGRSAFSPRKFTPRRRRLHAGGGRAQAVPFAGLKVGEKKGTGLLGQGSDQSTGPVRSGPPHPPGGPALSTTGGRVGAYLADAGFQSGSERRRIKSPQDWAWDAARGPQALTCAAERRQFAQPPATVAWMATQPWPTTIISKRLVAGNRSRAGQNRLLQHLIQAAATAGPRPGPPTRYRPRRVAQPWLPPRGWRTAPRPSG